MKSTNAPQRLGAKVLRALAEPIPLRFQFLRALDMWLNFLPYAAKISYRSIDRPYFGHCLCHAAMLARQLGHNRIAAIEFGVAGGNGLLSLERHARMVERETGVAVQVYGFDTGSGMPQLLDYRDQPYLYEPGYFKMDIEKLKARLTTAKLCIGPIEDTLTDFVSREEPPPIGFIAVDVDYYSSTVPILRIFEADQKYLLPRVACYLDDITGDIDWAFNEFTGELLAINEFNAAHDDIKIAPVKGLRYANNHIPQEWHEKVFVAHLFKHPHYGHLVSKVTQLPIVA
jgi:hypothetical protein